VKKVYRVLFNNVHYKLISLLFAVLLWLLAVNKETAEVIVKLRYVPVSAGSYRILDYRPKMLNVELVGYRKDLVTVGNLKQVSLLLSKKLSKSEGWIRVKVEKNNLILPVESVKVKGIKPKWVEIKIEKIVKKLVPVEADLTGVPKGATVKEEPNYVVVSVPEGKAEEVKSVKTERVDLSGVKLPAVLVLKLKSRFEVEPETVKVTVEEKNEGKEEALWNGRDKGDSK